MRIFIYKLLFYLIDTDPSKYEGDNKYTFDLSILIDLKNIENENYKFFQMLKKIIKSLKSKLRKKLENSLEYSESLRKIDIDFNDSNLEFYNLKTKLNCKNEEINLLIFDNDRNILKNERIKPNLLCVIL